MAARPFITLHALERINEMDLNERQVRDVVGDPETTWESRGRIVATRGEIAVVYNPETMEIVTVLANRPDEWIERGRVG